MILHDLKDLVNIYNEQEWDKATIKVWQPDEQRTMSLSFCGSSKPGVNGEEGEINFISSYNDELGENGVLNAYKEILKEEFNVTDEEKVRKLVEKYLVKIMEPRRK